MNKQSLVGYQEGLKIGNYNDPMTKLLSNIRETLEFGKKNMKYVVQNFAQIRMIDPYPYTETQI